MEKTANIVLVNMSRTNNRPPEVGTDEVTVRVDGISPLANPYKPTNGTYSERERVCDLYDSWFSRQIVSNNKPVINELTRIVTMCLKYKVVYLCCWCYPLRCHSDGIKDVLTRALSKREKPHNERVTKFFGYQNYRSENGIIRSDYDSRTGVTTSEELVTVG